MSKPTYIDGIGSSQAIDTAGEIVDLKGLDISSLVGGAFNWEHESKAPSQIVGKILLAHKIFTQEDCQNERQLMYWNKCQLPFLYVMGRLFDDKKPSSVEVAALFKDDAENPNESDMVAFSVEGSKLEKVGMVVTRSIARKMTITHIPANKTCIAEMLPDAKESAKATDPLASLFKGEMEVFAFQPTYTEIMEKKETFEELEKSLPEGWKGMIAGNEASFEHAKHGSVRVNKTRVGNYEVRHNDKLVGVSPHISHAGEHAKKYMTGLKKNEVPTSQNECNEKVPLEKAGEMPKWSQDARGDHSAEHGGHKFKIQQSVGVHRLQHTNPKGEMTSYGPFGSPDHAKTYAHGLLGKSEPLKKAMEAGSGNAAPGDLSQGAALASESLSVAKPKKKKTDWYGRAEQAYGTWDKKSDFVSFMKKRLPHLAEGEIDAIGRVLALKKAHQAEQKLSQMYAGQIKKTEDTSEEMEKALKFGTPEDQAHVAAKMKEMASNPKQKYTPPSKGPDLKGVVHSEVSHTERSHLGEKYENVHLKTGHQLDGHPAGKFKAGDKVTAKPHIGGTHLMEHRK